MYSVVVTVFALSFLGLFSLLFIRSGYLNKLLFKLGLKGTLSKTNFTAVAWNNCLKKAEYKADIAFFGDSLTYGSNFHRYWKDRRIVNLGCGGDSIQDLINRIYLLETVSPKKIFILCGINGLTDFNINKSAQKYEELIKSVKNVLPDAQLYIQSVLPIAKSKERSICHNSTIKKFNSQLKIIAEKYNTNYVDLHPLFFLNDELNPKLTKDGLHLLPEAYNIWKNAVEKYI